MSTTPNLDLPYILPSQAQKHVTHNEAIRRLDAVVQIAIRSRELAVPPAAPDDGARYIIAAPASGAWTGHEGDIAAFQDGAWAFLAPRDGWLAWIENEGALLVRHDSGWIAPVALNPAPRLGVNAVAAGPNRVAVKSDAVLFSHDDMTPGSGDIRQVINKAAPSATASLVYQSNWSARAETGLAGDDDYRIKVSPDGATWIEALVVARGNGAVSVPRPASPWKGRKWVALGTSITAEGQYTTPLADLLETQLVNLAVGGATLAASIIPVQIPQIDPDAALVTLEAGINDFPSGLALGSPGDMTAATFHGALHVAVDAILNRAPGAVVALMTPFSAGPAPDGSLPPAMASRSHLATNGGTRLRQWQQAVRDVAALAGWPLLDIGRDAAFNAWTTGEYTIDGLNPGVEGGLRMARFIADQLIRLRPRAGSWLPPAAGSALDVAAKGANAVLSQGARILSTAQAGWTSARGAAARNAGRRYFEAKLIAVGNPLNTVVGLSDATWSGGVDAHPGAFAYSIGVKGDRIWNNVGGLLVTQAATPVFTAAVNDTIMVAVDFDSGSLWFGRNGAWLTGTPAAGSTAGRNGSFAAGLALFPSLGVAGSTNAVRLATAAADQHHAPPAGFSAWG